MTLNSKNILLILILFATFSLQAQQDPHYTQYMYNMSVINPAYATDSQELVNGGFLYRAQWVGSVGGPTTGNFFAHTPISQKQEIGVSMVHDEIGDIVKETNVYADYAYKIKTGENTKISFGIKGGATFFSTDFNGMTFTNPNPDPAFANNLSRVFPNLGVGTYFYGEQFYLGLSAPNLFMTKQLEKKDGVYATGVEEIHYYLTGGYVFNLSDDFKLKPAFMAKAVKGAPVSLDLTANVLMFNKVEVGTGYRWGDAVSALVNFKINPKLRIGYAYDYTLTNLGNFNSGSHEFLLLFNLAKSKKSVEESKGFDRSPRFF